MQLSLDRNDPSKGWMLTASELASDDGFKPWDASWWLDSPDAERLKFDAVVRRLADELNVNVFNQCRWQGVSGWEYWSDDHDKILAHAERVAGELGVELNL